jgi:DNA-binding beta-propeller fold protein YncE
MSPSRAARCLLAPAFMAFGCVELAAPTSNGARADLAVDGNDDLGVDAIADLALSDLSVAGAMPDLRLVPPPDLSALVDGVPPADLAPVLVPDVVHQIAGVTVETLAGSSLPGAMDGTGAAAQLDNPVGLALDGNGRLYVTEYDGNRIRTVDTGGATGTLTAGGGAYTFACPFAITVASSAQLLVQTDCDTAGNKSDTSGTLWRVDIATGIPTPAVQGLGRPRGLSFVDANTVAVSDRVHETVSTLAATGSALTLLAGRADNAGWVDATGAAARFNEPYGLGRMPDGSIVVADTSNNRVRRLSGGGVVTTLGGGDQRGNVDGTRSDARFNLPRAVAVDSAGEVFVSDNGDHRIRRIASDGTVMTVAGDGLLGFNDGAGAQAEFYGQEGIAVTPDGKTVYVADGNNGDGSAHHRIRMITIP